MRGFSLPKKIHTQIDKICKNFLWGHTALNKKTHLIKWEIIPKSYGGLGLKNSSIMNVAFMARLKWDIKTNYKKPWVSFFISKYKDPNKCYRNPFFTYKSIKKDKNIFSENFFFLVRDGQLNLWNDP